MANGGFNPQEQQLLQTTSQLSNIIGQAGQAKQQQIQTKLKQVEQTFNKIKTGFSTKMNLLKNKSIPANRKVEIYNTLDADGEVLFKGQGITFGQINEWKPEFNKLSEQAVGLFTDSSIPRSEIAPSLNALRKEAAGLGRLPEFNEAIQPSIEQFGGTGTITPIRSGTIETPSRINPLGEAIPITQQQTTPTGISQQVPIQQLSEEALNREDKLRGEFIKRSGDFFKIRDAFQRVQASAEDPSPAGDLALVFNFMKILDPGSVVRESEFANASNAGGVPEQTRRLFNNLQRAAQGKGAFILSNNQRKDFTDRADRLFDRQEKQHTKRISSFSKLADDQGVRSKTVTIDLGPAGDAPEPGPVKNITIQTDLSTLSNEQLQKIINGEF